MPNKGRSSQVYLTKIHLIFPEMVNIIRKLLDEAEADEGKDFDLPDIDLVSLARTLLMLCRMNPQ